MVVQFDNQTTEAIGDKMPQKFTNTQDHDSREIIK